MWQSIKDWFTNSSTTGIHFPYAYDADKGKPSVTLFFSYVAFYALIVSLLILHYTLYFDKTNMIYATLVTLGVFGVCMIFYLLRRRLKNVELNLNEKSIKLEGDESNGNTD